MSCACSPPRSLQAPEGLACPLPGSRGDADIETVPVPGGRVRVGTDRPLHEGDGEGPLRRQAVRPFRIGVTTVTNSQFARFVAATGFVTEAECFGWSYVFYSEVVGVPETAGVVGVEWWRRVDGACWSAPFGPASDLSGRAEYPVVHVSWNDAAAFAAWAGGRLPTEAEWEHAARGGLTDPVYPWGDRPPDDIGFMPCNIWQGAFPYHDLGHDGHRGLAPARCFAPNGYGLFAMAGNCWEWSADPFRIRSMRRAARLAAADGAGRRLLKGGSYLCHASYCHRYRIAARMGNTPDSTTGHTGFRVAFDFA